MVIDISLATLRTIRSGQSGSAISAIGCGGVRHGLNLPEGDTIARTLTHQLDISERLPTERRRRSECIYSNRPLNGWSSMEEVISRLSFSARLRPAAAHLRQHKAQAVERASLARPWSARLSIGQTHRYAALLGVKRRRY